MSKYLDDAFSAYLETALWASTDEDVNLDDHDIDDGTKAELFEEFKRFFNEAIALSIDPTDSDSDRLDLQCCIIYFDGSEYDGYERLGHDFWLTRNGHGAGFWDGDWDRDEPDIGPMLLGDRLTTLAKNYGECDLYIGDDGKIYKY